MTTKVQVKLKLKVWSSFGREQIEETVEVDLLENAAGRVFVDHGDQGAVSVKVEVTDLGDARPFIEDTRLVLRPDHTTPQLRGKVTPRGKKAPIDGGLKVEGRPLLRELYDGAIALDGQLEAARKAIWREEREQVESRAIAGFPAGSVLLRFAHSEADGWIECWRDPEGRLLRSPTLGGRSGSLGWMTPEGHATAAAGHDAAEAAREAEAGRRREAEARRQEGLLEVEVPADALAAYRRHQGDDVAAWGDEDETGAALIRMYADAIEAQGLARPGPAVARRILRGDDALAAEE